MKFGFLTAEDAIWKGRERLCKGAYERDTENRVVAMTANNSVSLRKETTMTMAWIAERTHLAHLLYWEGKKK